MELGVGSHPGPDIYAYYLRSCCAELLDIGTSYPIRATTVATASPSTTHLQAHRRYLSHVMTGTDPLLGTHRPRYTLLLHWIRLIMTTLGIQSYLCTDPRYSHRVHVTAVIPQVRAKHKATGHQPKHAQINKQSSK
ncbi:UNVERIFIED_CONTAM: hypothetical protein Slati_2926300 [Sesamum latifolium]|uniref:Uncharacterized protein n=1 Tax=Sesamum latifolium TaxID=2727402 RepID=A0AAW2VGV1_9LAMI